MKNLILTICVGETYEDMGKLTLPNIQAYAKKVGADFECITTSNTSSPHWQKFKIYDRLETYDRVLYFDSDIIIRPDCPNLFEIVPEDKLAMFDSLPTDARFREGGVDIDKISASKVFNVFCEKYGVTLKDAPLKHYNSGVMLVPKMYRDIFVKPENEFPTKSDGNVIKIYDQGFINLMVFKWMESHPNMMYDLDISFNRNCMMDIYVTTPRTDAYIIHYAAHTPALDYVIGLIKSDLSVWKKQVNG